ncbi:XRE family transcriptional regulator [Pseudoflavonifractor sp. 60]|uniref:helix-turn-helix domain-containing protein n=1 Tax=Pseudoflavonifractor sp. 60 TaxID=2304576 RepID=UPI00136E083D|nr:helix-turn-helix transcriptional regulator [Pseudoflavonifractor sp. 60]NBI68936.1 XRE family transcriptional regulator [Pseudoflavonifractor sp. 60]
MGMLENMAEMMQAKKEREKDSVERFSEKLEISPSTLQDYLKARGNPTVKMIERLAKKMDVDPVALVSGTAEPEQYQTLLLMLDTIEEVSSLTQPKRVKFAELFLELVQLWEEEE